MDLKNIAVLGLARSGIAAAYKIRSLGGNPFLSEYKSFSEMENALELQTNFSCEFGGHTDKLLKYETIIVSPGISLNTKIINKLRKNGNELISEIEFGFRIKHPQSKIIAITGTNGKSTTVSLIDHILQIAGYNSILAGNIGNAFTSFPIENAGIEFVVLEISSFQLDLIKSFRPDIAAVLNITPDHLDRYQNFEHYALSKMNIFMNSKENDISIINADDVVIKKYISKLKGIIKCFSLKKSADIYYSKGNIIYNDQIFDLKHSKLIGQHNIQNIMASILAIDDFIKDKAIYEKAFRTFQPLPHRLEFCREINGISFYNDSKATNSDSVKYALQSFSKPVRVILGGSDKGEDFSVLKPILKKFAQKIYLIGETKEKMLKAFSNLESIETFVEFDKCIQKAFQESLSGDIILLSPGCASFDMFKNYEDRGNNFKQIVMSM